MKSKRAKEEISRAMGCIRHANILEDRETEEILRRNSAYSGKYAAEAEGTKCQLVSVLTVLSDILNDS